MKKVMMMTNPIIVNLCSVILRCYSLLPCAKCVVRTVKSIGMQQRREPIVDSHVVKLLYFHRILLIILSKNVKMRNVGQTQYVLCHKVYKQWEKMIDVSWFILILYDITKYILFLLYFLRQMQPFFICFGSDLNSTIILLWSLEMERCYHAHNECKVSRSKSVILLFEINVIYCYQGLIILSKH